MAGAWASCDRCDFRVRDAECKQEWTGLKVCARCYDPRPPWLDPPVIDPLEGSPVPNARFQRTPIFADDDNPVTAEQL